MIATIHAAFVPLFEVVVFTTVGRTVVGEGVARKRETKAKLLISSSEKTYTTLASITLELLLWRDKNVQ